MKTKNTIEECEVQDALVARPKNENHILPDYDKSTTTKKACIGAIIIGALLSFTCFVLSVIIFAKSKQLNASLLMGPVPGYAMFLSAGASEVLALTVNVILTLCLEGLAFVHATSLRWALYRENRLSFNTNLRLLTSAKSSGPNKIYVNTISVVSLILCYAATSQLFIVGAWNGQELRNWVSLGPGSTLINAVALFILALGLLVNTLIALWSLKWNLRHVPTWSSSPLTNTLAALHHNHHISHHPDRCMMSVNSVSLPARATLPSHKQPSLLSTIPKLRYLIFFIYSLAVLSLIWFLTILLLSRSITPTHDGWHFTMSWSIVFGRRTGDPLNGILFSTFSGGGTGGTRSGTVANGIKNANLSRPLQHIICFLFVTAIQCLQTIGLHCVELVVNANRDEDVWRQAAVFPSSAPLHSSKNRFISLLSRLRHGGGSGDGAPLVLNSTTSALRNPAYLILFTLKALLHWSLGQSVLPSYSVYGIVFYITYGRIFVYMVLVIVLAVFTHWLCVRRPKGPQPVSWGNLQTLADLVDDWGGVDGELEDGKQKRRCFWGDKGPSEREDNFRHAGTAATRELVSEIEFGVLYGGRMRRKQE